MDGEGRRALVQRRLATQGSQRHHRRAARRRDGSIRKHLLEETYEALRPVQCGRRRPSARTGASPRARRPARPRRGELGRGSGRGPRRRPRCSPAAPLGRAFAPARRRRRAKLRGEDRDLSLAAHGVVAVEALVGDRLGARDGAHWQPRGRAQEDRFDGAHGPTVYPPRHRIRCSAALIRWSALS